MNYVTERNHTVFVFSKVGSSKKTKPCWTISKDPVKRWIKEWGHKYLPWQEAEKITGVPVPEQLELL